MSSISLGVAALVGIDSFAANITQSVREQSRALVGGDLAFSSSQPFSPATSAWIDSLAGRRIPIARSTSFASMALVPRSSGTRLVQVRGVSPEYPLYGAVGTAPAGRWAILQQGPNAIVDPALLIALGANVGDTLALGYGRFAIIGTLQSVPGDPGLESAIAPRVYIPQRYIADTKLLTFGARAEYAAFARLPETVDPGRFVLPFQKRLEKEKVRIRTVSERESNLTRAIANMSKFLGVVGIVALLLGGIGVASGVHAFVARKIDTVAVLRCLGATSRQVMLIYVSQAALMGLAGAAVGAALGVGIQFSLPRAFGQFLPVDVSVHLAPMAIVTGLALGAWVALAFAMQPLVALRTVSPLQALRRDADPAPLSRNWSDPPRLIVNLLIAGTVVFIAATRATRPRDTVGFTAGIGAALLLLTLSAGLISRLARRVLRAGWPYVVRQGVANLYRPANQTRAVVLSLGFGAFLITTLYLVQANLLRQFSLDAAASRGNLIFFDVQDDQATGVQQAIEAQGFSIMQKTPIVVMRIAAVNGRETSKLLADSGRRGGNWTLRREYRSTYRDSLLPSERVLSGTPLGRSKPGKGEPAAEVSLETQVMKDLGVKVGDVIVWDVQGVRVPTRVTSERDVNWARFEPNFFAVFSRSAIETAPKQFVFLSSIPDAAAAARVQRAVVVKYPNVSSIDLSLIKRTIDDIVRKVSVAIRFLAVFSVAMGIPVLFSAVAATRRERIREGVLLKTLGATKAQIGRILLAEYALLGVFGSLTGMVLSFGGAWAVMHFVFEQSFSPASPPAFLIAGVITALTISIGLLSGRDVFRETPMAALREA